MVQVTKADGTRQLFSREKVMGTAMKLGVSRSDADAIAGQIEAKLHDGMPTSAILDMVFREVSKEYPDVRYQIDLRKAIGLIQSKPDFEQFVQTLLAENDYHVKPNEILKGKCGDHEADAIASKDGITNFVEVKHHRDYHKPTGLDDARIARAILEDVQERSAGDRNSMVIDRAMIVCNTKLSDHAKRYTTCRGIEHIGWGHPPGRDLRSLIEARRVYPVTLLKDLSPAFAGGLARAGVVTLGQLISLNPEVLGTKAGIGGEALILLQERAKQFLARIPGPKEPPGEHAPVMNST